MGSRGINAEYMGKFSFPRLIVVPLSIHLLVEYISRQRSSNLFPSGCYIKTNAIQEQIAASHEFDGVRKEKERLTAEKKKKKKILRVYTRFKKKKKKKKKKS